MLATLKMAALAAAAATAVSADGPVGLPGYNPSAPTFTEDFSGSLSNWERSFDGWLGAAPALIQDANVQATGGNAVISVKPEAAGFGAANNGNADDCDCGYGDISSGLLKSKATFGEGYYQAEVSTDSQSPFMAAFWLQGTKGEINVMEFVGAMGSAGGSASYWTNYHCFEEDGGAATVSDKEPYTPASASQYASVTTYAVDWHGDTLDFYADGSKIRSASAACLVGEQMNIILSHEANEEFGGVNTDPASLAEQHDMRVGSVKFWAYSDKTTTATTEAPPAEVSGFTLVGADRKGLFVKGNGYLGETGEGVATAAECAQRCSAPACKGFSHRASTQQCQLYTAAGMAGAYNAPPGTVGWNLYKIIEAPATTAAPNAAENCDDLGWPAVDNVCASRKVNGDCSHTDDSKTLPTFEQAEERCASVGARLCTADEVKLFGGNADFAKFLSRASDHPSSACAGWKKWQKVWTSGGSCGAGQAYGSNANGAGSCADKASTSAHYGQCCKTNTKKKFCEDADEFTRGKYSRSTTIGGVTVCARSNFGYVSASKTHKQCKYAGHDDAEEFCQAQGGDLCTLEMMHGDAVESGRKMHYLGNGVTKDDTVSFGVKSSDKTNFWRFTKDLLEENPDGCGTSTALTWLKNGNKWGERQKFSPVGSSSEANPTDLLCNTDQYNHNSKKSANARATGFFRPLTKRMGYLRKGYDGKEIKKSHRCAYKGVESNTKSRKLTTCCFKRS